MKTHCIGLAMIAASLKVVAQSQTPLPNPYSWAPPAIPRGVGPLTVTVLPMPHSLKQLADLSSLIVEGVIEKVMPARGSAQTWIETDSVIHIVQTLKGSAGSSTIVISQAGGTVGDATSQPTQYSLVQAGERYILCLKEDNRTTVPSVAGWKRYGIVAAWSGLLFVGADGLIHTDPKYTDSLRKTFEGKSEASMIDLINNAMVAAPTPVPPPFPGILK
ncbi:MAG: hypothetical protein ABI833_12900 [Acidobacteriota bacterium]